MGIYLRPVIPLTIALMAGIICGRYFPSLGLWAVVLAAAVFLWLVFGCRFQKAVRLTPLLLFAALGYLSILPWVAPKLPANHISRFADNRKWLITGQIIEPPAPRSRAVRFVMDIRLIKRADQQDVKPCVACGKLRLTLTDSFEPLSIGDTLTVLSKIRLTRSFANPGGFDYQRHMAYQKIWATAYVSAKNVSGHMPADANKWFDLSRIRRRINNLIDSQTKQPDVRGVLKALLLGDRREISPRLREAFSRSGVGHMLAISGLHIGIVAAMAFLLASRLLAFIKLLIWHGWVKKSAAFLALLVIVAYGALAGWSPSTQRAVIMVAVFLAAFWVQRQPEPFNTLAWAALIILIIHPPTLFTISFQLSFSAVLAILYGLISTNGYAVFNIPGETPTKMVRLGDKLIAFMLVSLLAILGTLPFLMYYFNQMSTIGVLTNILIVPLMGSLVVPIGLLAIFLFLLKLIAPAAWLLKLAAIILTPILKIVFALANLSFAAVKTFTPSTIEMGCYFMLGWALFAFLRRPGQAQSDLDRPAHHRRWAMGVMAAALLVLTVDAGYWVHQRFFSKMLRVTVLDVGHGNAAVLELPAGRVFLIDGGGFYDNTVFDVGQRIVAPYLWRRKIMSVERLILSHPNSDHLNGLIYIAANFNVKSLWTNHQKAESIGYKTLMTTAAEKKIQMPPYDGLFGEHLINGVKLKILYPPPGFNRPNRQPSWRDPNNNSIVVKVTRGRHSLLLPGDIMKKAEKDLVSMAGQDLAADILVAPHHGSKSSNSPLFIRHVQPKTVIISSRFNPNGRYPPKQVLKRYKKQGCNILRTDLNGAIRIQSNGQNLKITTSRPDSH